MCCDRNGQTTSYAELPSGRRGEIRVRGPQVMAGYWRNAAATAEVIDDAGWFHTGDVGEAAEDGYIYVVDRVKDVVITGGENVYPAEVETVLYDHPAVAEVAVISLSDESWGEVVVAVVAPKAGARLILDELRSFAKDRLAGYKLPRRLELVDQLPRNAAGKTVKYELRAPSRTTTTGRKPDMTATENEPTVDDHIRAALLRLLEEGDRDLAHEIYADDAVLEFPQSGERFVGKQNFLEWRRQYPADVEFVVRRIQGGGALWIMEGSVRYDGGEWSYGVSIHEFRDRLMVRETIYWGPGWEAPDWRAPWRATEPANALTQTSASGGVR